MDALRRLNLDQNHATSTGVIGLANELKINNQLEFIGLALNEFDIDGVHAFEEMLSVNTTLLHWHLSSLDLELRQIEAVLNPSPKTNYFQGSWIRSHALMESTLEKGTQASVQELKSPESNPGVAHITKIFQPELQNARNATEDKSHSRIIDQFLEQAATAGEEIQKIMLYGRGELLTNLIKEISLYHQDIPLKYQQLVSEKLKASVLKFAQQLVASVPHYTYVFASFWPQAHLAQQLLLAETLDEKSGEIIARLWNDSQVQRAFAASQEGDFFLPHSVSMLFERVRIIARSDYVPSIADILYWRALGEVNVVEYQFTFEDFFFELVSGDLKLWELSQNDKQLVVFAAHPWEVKQAFRRRKIPSLEMFSLYCSTLIIYAQPAWNDGYTIELALNHEGEIRTLMEPHVKLVYDARSLQEIFAAWKDASIREAFEDAGLV